MNEVVTQTKTVRTLNGLVVQASADKTVRVRIERRVKHRRYGKIIKRRNHLLVHDANNECVIGDLVIIAECRPLSKRKSWQVIEKKEKQK